MLFWRRLSSIEGFGVRVHAWSLRRPGAAAGMVLLFAVVGMGMASGPMFLEVRYMAVSEFQRLALWQTTSSLVLDLVVPALVSFWLLRKLACLERGREPAS